MVRTFKYQKASYEGFSTKTTKARPILWVILIISFSTIPQVACESKPFDIEAVKQRAEQGHADAQINLAVMYEGGRGVPQDYKKAVYWFMEAAEQGNAYAQDNLGRMYEKGTGVPQNYVQAYAWVNLSSAQGYKNAIENRKIISRNLTSHQIAQAQEYLWIIFGDLQHGFYCYVPFSPRSGYHLKVF